MMYHKKEHRRDIAFIASSATLIFLPLFQVGISHDFAMRVSIPALICLGIEFIRLVSADIPSKEILKDPRKLINTKPLLTAALLIFCIGAANPVSEFSREAMNTFYFGTEKETDAEYMYSLNDYDEKENFAAVGYKESLFYKYLLRK